jgi:sec-independent protein translocase protein TatA
MGFGSIGAGELLILLLVILLVFGPKRLPEMGRSLGKGMREFKNSITKDDHVQPELTTATAVEEPVRSPASTSKRELDSI